MTAAVRWVCFGMVWLLAACDVGPVQLEVPESPGTFRDVRTREIVSEVLCLPRYSESVGLSTGAGHGPGWMHNTFVVAHPFIYRAGTPFKPVQPSSRGLLLGAVLFVGKGVTIDGILAVAPGYQSLWVWNLWRHQESLQGAFDLSPLPPEAAKAELREIGTLLKRSLLSGRDKDRWSLGDDLTLDVRLTAEDQALVGAFLSPGLSLLEPRKAGK